MDDLLKSCIAECRRRHQNPYAFIEYLDEFDVDVPASLAASEVVRLRLSASRKVLEDPCAYLDGDGGFSAASPDGVTGHQDAPMSSTLRSPSVDNTKRRYSDAKIEVAATALQRQLWRERDRLWDGAPPNNPLEVLDIRKALGLVGYELVFESGLGHDPRTHIEVAGLIDRDAKVVKASLQFPEISYQRFTLAHELGHAVLHPDGGGIHRDRPLDGIPRSREPGEWEADRFATFFLMPAKLLRECFHQCFGTDCFALTDDTAFALSRTTSDFVREKNPTRRHLARTLAAAETYNTRSFRSLANQFGVSVGAMAIRIEELDLLEP
ncbi:ImmA/IrrE family metallo-endopeptidase [Rhodanobacter sp. AS-Z3]|uniref:ImmA/IrrE family metallo-endopeptidase n=1 Tax=Rhodanobacter sp. AS-Z3 TaxID=3031330 RepID=UPI00247A546D|nr:ImmA/IrrE family metallo-endopeptidase [Rhodanobacter sp. AS-Z3]WEN13907.1 ImmA/IrrE family metallo-endopeptidase [Rhodanobacter sp. AS-Z3]